MFDTFRKWLSSFSYPANRKKSGDQLLPQSLYLELRQQINPAARKKETSSMLTLTTTQADLLAKIRQTTDEANLNNVTRTAAYLSFYRRHPEIEWALLAHLVSRNGGWNMTDLRGEWLPRILSEKEIEAFFQFLERCNWLIFHDAYAQLLLYEEMKETGQDLTNLLPTLGVSTFMIPLWKNYLQKKNNTILTRGLIINEQQYIQQRVVHQPFYQEKVLDTFEFQAQSVLSLNQVIFPYKNHPSDKQLSVVGVVVHRFPSVEQRINIGKSLYQLLFSDANLLGKIKEWAFRIPHSGSRSDYWPHVFSTVKETVVQKQYSERLKGAELRPGKAKLYSPKLTAVWPNTVQPAADGSDWYRNEKWIEHLQEDAELPTIDTKSYTDSLNRVEAGLKLLNPFI